jgi:hypothetical protein
LPHLGKWSEKINMTVSMTSHVSNMGYISMTTHVSNMGNISMTSHASNMGNKSMPQTWDMYSEVFNI